MGFLQRENEVDDQRGAGQNKISSTCFLNTFRVSERQTVVPGSTRIGLPGRLKALQYHRSPDVGGVRSPFYLFS